MECLETEIPATSAEFKNGSFVLDKTNPAFSSLPSGQAHEQNNKIVKGEGGAIEVLHGSHVAWQEQKIPFPMGKEVLSYAEYFHCSCHATWLPCKTSIDLTESSTQSLRWMVSGPEINKDFELT